MGPGSERLTGCYEHSHVYEVMRDALFPPASAGQQGGERNNNGRGEQQRSENPRGQGPRN